MLCPVFVFPSQIRTFVVKFAGEGVRDNGGVYTEVFSSIMEELQSHTDPPTLPYFIRTPNARSGTGSYQDAWMPSPRETSHAALEAFRFIGQIIGMAIRGKVQLNFNVTPCFWKQLIGGSAAAPLGLADLESTDANVANLVSKMREQAKIMRAAAADASSSSSSSGTALAGIEPDEFGSMFGVENFTCVLSDGVTVAELVPGGASKPVTLDNFEEWIILMIDARVHECAIQIAALRSGLASLIPLHLLCFFTPAEAERLVCGVSDFPVELLQSVTIYEGAMREDLEYVRWFWETLRDFTSAQKAQFLRFTFARERMPARPAELGIKFKMQEPNARTAKDPDQHFPSTHTVSRRTNAMRPAGRARRSDLCVVAKRMRAHGSRNCAHMFCVWSAV